MTRYVLEVVKFIHNEEGGGKHTHIGYMKCKFKTKNSAVSYYDKHNEHMRSLNAHGDYKSDWDPNTSLLYIVRTDYLVNASVDCFDINDNNKLIKT